MSSIRQDCFVSFSTIFRRPQFNSWVRKIRWRRDRLPTLIFLGFPGGSAGKKSACNATDLGSIPGLGRSSGEGNGYPLQYSSLDNSMDCIVHGVAKSLTQLNDFHYYIQNQLSNVWSPVQKGNTRSPVKVLLRLSRW